MYVYIHIYVYISLSSSFVYHPGNELLETPELTRGFVRWENQRMKWEMFIELPDGIP